MCCHGHVHVGEIVLAEEKKHAMCFLGGKAHITGPFKYAPLSHVLEGSEGELGPHPQPPRRPDVGHNLHLSGKSIYRPFLKYS